jgi:hypothetical protein
MPLSAKSGSHSVSHDERANRRHPIRKSMTLIRPPAPPSGASSDGDSDRDQRRCNQERLRRVPSLAEA